MSECEAKLKGHETVAEGTMAFHFEKPADFRFKAGQSVDVSLLQPLEAGAGAGSRTFSLVSAPYEDELVVATRMRDSGFKRALKALPVGAAVKIDGPHGSMRLHGDSSKPAVLLAGGIGITPFVSMVRQATKDRLPHRLYLFYSNRRPEDAPFLLELERLQQANSNYRLIATMTEMEKSSRPWQGERGVIGKDMLAKYLGNLALPIYYVAGPPGLVMAMQDMLSAAGVSEDNVRGEEFYGY